MAGKTRAYNFIVGPETSTLPTAGTPSSDSDLVTLGYANSHYVQGGDPVANITALKALDVDDRTDNDVIFVDSEQSLFQYDSGSSATGDDLTIVAPDAGSGRWIRVGQKTYFGNTGEIRFYELISNGSNYASIKAPDALSASYDLVLPVDDGASGQFLSTDGSGTLSWNSPTGGGALTTDVQSTNTSVSSGTTLAHSNLTIDTGYTYTISGSLVGIGTLTIDGTLTVNAGGLVIYV